MSKVTLPYQILLTMKSQLSGLSAAQRRIGKMESSVSKLKKTGRSMRLFSGSGIGIAAAGATGLTFGLKSVTTQALEFNKALNNLEIRGKLAGNQLNTLKSIATSLAGETIFSDTEIIEAMGQLGQRGFKFDQIRGTIGGVTKLAAAEGTGLSLAVDTLFQSMKQFNLGVEDQVKTLDGEYVPAIDHLANVFFKAGNESAAGLEFIAKGSAKVGTIAGQMGVGVEDVASAMAVFADRGLEAEESGTALRNVLLRLRNPSKEAMESMRNLGIDTKAFFDPETGSFKGLVPAVAEFGRATDALREKLGAKIGAKPGTKEFDEAMAGAPEFGQLANIFEQRATGPMLALMNGLKDMTTLSDGLKTPGEMMGVDEAAEKRMKNGVGDVEKLKAAFSALRNELGSFMIPVLVRISDSVMLAFKAFRVVGEEIGLFAGGGEEAGIAMDSLAIAIGTHLAKFAQWVKGATPVLDLLVGLANGFGRLLEAIMNTTGPILKALKPLTTGMSLMFEGIGDVLGWVIDKLASFVGLLGDLITMIPGVDRIFGEDGDLGQEMLRAVDTVRAGDRRNIEDRFEQLKGLEGSLEANVNVDLTTGEGKTIVTKSSVVAAGLSTGD